MRISDCSSDVCASDLPRLGALDAAHAITQAGRRMLARGTHPRLAAMLLAASEVEDRALACDLAALVEARDPLRSRSDALAERWRALAAFRNWRVPHDANRSALAAIDRSEEHTSELQSLMRISYAVFCLNKKQIEYSILSNLVVNTTITE